MAVIMWKTVIWYTTT